MSNELDQFLSDIQSDQPELDILTGPLNPTPEKVEEQKAEQEVDGNQKEEDSQVEDEEDDMSIKPRNRREKRLMEKLRVERESSIFLAGKLEAREEAKKLLSEEEADYLKGIERIYGTDSPEAELATSLLKKAIVGAREDAENRAFQRFQQTKQEELKAVQEAEQKLNSIVEDIQDEYGVDLTPAQEKQYFELLQKMSPKDANGEVITLADPRAVFEIFSDRLKSKGTDNQAKKLSTRSMTQSGASTDSKLEDDVVARELRDMGII